MPDGSITFSTALDNTQLEKDYARTVKKIDDLEKRVAELRQKRSEANERSVFGADELDAEKAKLAQMKAELQELRSIAKDTSLSPSVRAEARAQIPAVNAGVQEQQQRVNMLQREWSKIADSVDRYDRQIEETTAELDRQKTETGALAERLNAAGSASEGMGQAVDRAGKYLDKFAGRLKKLAARVFVFTLITTALRGMRTWLGNIVKSNDEARAAIARLKGALLTLAQPLVEVIIPAFITLVNVLAKIVAVAAQIVSLLFGKTIKQSAEAAENLYNEQKALEGVGAAAEEAAGSLAGFDEINTIQTETPSNSGVASSDEIAPDFSWTDGITDKLKEIADLVLLIGAGLALWKLGSVLPGILGTILQKLGSILMVVGGLLLFWNGLTDAWENGVDWLNLIEMVGGLAAAVFGLYQLFGPITAGIALVVGGLAMLVTGFHDAMENGWNLQNTLLSIAGIVATGLGFFFITGSVIPLVIAGIAALLLAFTVATGHGEELLSGIRTMLEGFIQFFKGVFSGDIEMTIGGIVKIFDGLGMSIGAIIDGVRDTFLGFLDWLDEKTGGKLHGIIEAIKELFVTKFKIIKETVLNVIQALKQIFTGLVQFISGVFTGDWNRAWEGVKNIFKGLWNGIVGITEGAFNLIISGVNWLIKQLNKISFTVPSWVPGVGGKSIGINIPSVGTVSLPRLATGAVIPPNREFMAVLGDQTHGNNIEAPEDLIRKIVREEAGGNGEMLAVLQQILAATKAGHVIKVKEREFGRAVVEAADNITTTTGKFAFKF